MCHPSDIVHGLGISPSASTRNLMNEPFNSTSVDCSHPYTGSFTSSSGNSIPGLAAHHHQQHHIHQQHPPHQQHHQQHLHPQQQQFHQPPISVQNTTASSAASNFHVPPYPVYNGSHALQAMGQQSTARLHYEYHHSSHHPVTPLDAIFNPNATTGGNPHAAIHGDVYASTFQGIEFPQTSNKTGIIATPTKPSRAFPQHGNGSPNTSCRDKYINSSSSSSGGVLLTIGVQNNTGSGGTGLPAQGSPQRLVENVLQLQY